MGTDKAFLEVDGRPLAVVAADALWEAGAQVVICVGGDDDRLRTLGLVAHPDEHPGEGPLGGLLTAFSATSATLVVALACDLPWVSAVSIRSLVAALVAAPGADAAVPLMDRRRQWLHAAYRRPAVPSLAAAFERGERSIERAARDLVLVDGPALDERTLADVDLPTDLAAPTTTLSPPSRDESETS